MIEHRIHVKFGIWSRVKLIKVISTAQMVDKGATKQQPTKSLVNRKSNSRFYVRADTRREGNENEI